MLSDNNGRDETRIPVEVDGHIKCVPAWMVETLYERARERGESARAERLLDALTAPREEAA